MTKRFTAIVPQEILSALGWNNPTTYAEVFDYFSDNGMLISISRYYDMADEMYEAASTIITAESTIIPKSIAPSDIRLPSIPKVFIIPNAKSILRE